MKSKKPITLVIKDGKTLIPISFVIGNTEDITKVTYDGKTVYKAKLGK